MKMCPKEIKHNIELSCDTIDEKYSVMKEKVVMWATDAAEKETGESMTSGKKVTSPTGWMRSARRRGTVAVRGTATWISSAPQRPKVAPPKVDERSKER